MRTDPKSLVANRGYSRYLKTRRGGMEIDRDKIEREARLDGIWVLQTNSSASAARIAWQYKNLWQVEHLFRAAKSLLRTRPVYHQCDAAIRGHVFCSFLALVLRKELLRRMEDKKIESEWNDIIRNLDSLTETKIETGERASSCAARRREKPEPSSEAWGFACPPSYGVRTVGTSLKGNRPQTDRRAYSLATEKAVCSATAFFCPRNPL